MCPSIEEVNLSPILPYSPSNTSIFLYQYYLIPIPSHCLLNPSPILPCPSPTLLYPTTILSSIPFPCILSPFFPILPQPSILIHASLNPSPTLPNTILSPIPHPSPILQDLSSRTRQLLTPLAVTLDEPNAILNVLDLGAKIPKSV
ncbi:hypothetical protein E2C01_039649 [Portunus trituberculatus]|uniref:Uncharacterized protein n=1 Tax=Portunus trituberculatus TaxID=210409 RepID=A0A5B7FL90_PORTR|nr:hypothetical protein [Portunus trituberculatus]